MAAPRSRKMISGDTTWLREAGFVDIRVTPKAESRDLISTWAPGSGIEEFVVSAIVEGRKPAV
jgi:arsenite methyltransferase